MSIKYELSLWRDFPGVNAIQEEKVTIIAATGMNNAGRAQNIELKKEYNGKLTLTFEIPVKYDDNLTGKQISNPLINQVIDQSKLKLWRDERWWNPFKGEGTFDEKTGCVTYEGGWEQGRWYEFIVTNRSQKHSKRRLIYTYSCDSLFMNELSRTGYDLEFVPDTDIMSANGMGTAHELAERIVEGTDWQYIKTEVFPDYKEEYNAITGETIKVPLATDQIEFAKGLGQYVYCYTTKVPEHRIEEISEEIFALGQKAGIELFSPRDFGFKLVDDNLKLYSLWWKPQINDLAKDYIYGYTKTNIINNYADKILCYTDGNIIKNKDEKVNEATLLNSTTLWEPMCDATVNIEAVNNGQENAYYYLKLGNTSANIPLVYNSGYSDKALEKGENLVLNLNQYRANVSTTCEIYIYDGKPSNDNNPVQYEIFEANSSNNCFNNSYILTLKQRVANPYFAFGYTDGRLEIINGLFIYKFVGATKNIDESIKKWIARQAKYCNKISELSDEYKEIQGVSNIDLNNNTCTINGEQTNFWVPVGSMSLNEYQNGVEVKCLEFFNNGEYIDIYPTFKDEELAKINSFETDKRRAINGSKSNRYSLLETVSKTFYCFTRFMVEHDEKGYIKTDSAGRPKKYFTYVSELGRRNFNGFTYGVNLDNVERKIDTSELVTKVFVEEIDNEYTNSGIITIQNSQYNKLGEKFFYNFSYYARKGFFDKSCFTKDYLDLLELVSKNNTQAKYINETYITKENYRQTKQTAYDTHLILIGTYNKQANEELDYLKWPRFKESVLNIAPTNTFVDEDFEFPTINFKKIVEETPIMNWEGSSYYEKIASYMFYTKLADSYEQTDAWVGFGGGINDIVASLESIGAQQTEYNNLNQTVINEKIELDKTSNNINELLNEYNKLIKEKDKKIKWFENRYKSFILEGTWSSNEYIDPDTYYLDATRAMSTSCMPRVTYNINVLDLSKACNPLDPTDEDWGKDFIFDIGDTTYIKDTELFGNVEQKSMIAIITSYIDSDKPDDLSLRNFETRFEELFQSIAAAVTTLQLNENIYSRAENFTPEGTIDTSILQKSFNENKNLVISSSNNLVTQDRYGITVKTDNNSGEVLRAIAGGIFVSNDNGKTFTAGLTAKGFNANLITAGQIDTSKIVIRNSDIPQYVWDTQGMTAYSMEEKDNIRENSFVRFDQFGTWMTDRGALFARNWWEDATNKEKESSEIEADYYTYPQGNRWLITKYPIERVNSIVDINGNKVAYTISGTNQINLPTRFKDTVIVSYMYKPYNSPTDMVRDNSIFSLTRRGLRINSMGANGGSIDIRTEDSTILSTDKNGNPRVKVGYIRYDEEDKEEIHGIDIYDGAFRLYGEPYDSLENTPAIWFNGDQMNIKAIFNQEVITKFSVSGTNDYAILKDTTKISMGEEAENILHYSLRGLKIKQEYEYVGKNIGIVDKVVNELYIGPQFSINKGLADSSCMGILHKGPNHIEVISVYSEPPSNAQPGDFTSGIDLYACNAEGSSGAYISLSGGASLNNHSILISTGTNRITMFNNTASINGNWKYNGEPLVTLHPDYPSGGQTYYATPTYNISSLLGAYNANSGYYVEVRSSAFSAARGITTWDSDARLKKNINDTKINALAIISKIRHREFNWKESDVFVSNGYIAQEIEKILPEAVLNISQEDGSITKQLIESKFIPYLTKAIQEQQIQIEQLKSQLASLTNS